MTEPWFESNLCGGKLRGAHLLEAIGSLASFDLQGLVVVAFPLVPEGEVLFRENGETVGRIYNFSTDPKDYE